MCRWELLSELKKGINSLKKSSIGHVSVPLSNLHLTLMLKSLTQILMKKIPKFPSLYIIIIDRGVRRVQGETAKRSKRTPLSDIFEIGLWIHKLDIGVSLGIPIYKKKIPHEDMLSSFLNRISDDFVFQYELGSKRKKEHIQGVFLCFLIYFHYRAFNRPLRAYLIIFPIILSFISMLIFDLNFRVSITQTTI